MATKYNYRYVETETDCKEQPSTIITTISNSPNFASGNVSNVGDECKSITDRSKLTHAVGKLRLDWIAAMHLKGETKGGYPNAMVTGLGGFDYLPTFSGYFKDTETDSVLEFGKDDTHTMFYVGHNSGHYSYGRQYELMWDTGINKYVVSVRSADGDLSPLPWDPTSDKDIDGVAKGQIGDKDAVLEEGILLDTKGRSYLILEGKFIFFSTSGSTGINKLPAPTFGKGIGEFRSESPLGHPDDWKHSSVVGECECESEKETQFTEISRQEEIENFDWTDYDKVQTMDDVLDGKGVNWLGAGFTMCDNELLGADKDDCECNEDGCCDGARVDSPKMLMSVPIEFTIVDTETGEIKQTFARTIDDIPAEYFDSDYQCKFDGETSTATKYKGCDGQYYLRMTLCAKNPEKDGESICSEKTLNLPDPINPDLLDGVKLKKETFQVKAGIPGGVRG